MVFADGEFYGFAMILNKRKKMQEELRREIKSKEYVIDTYGEETEEYKEPKMDLGERGNESDSKIDLSCGFEELRRNLADFEEVGKLKTNFPQPKKKTKMIRGRSFWKEKKMVGIRIKTRQSRKQMMKI